jgi:hypothetical protein
MREDSATWRVISWIEELSSSVAEATVCTLDDASSEAPATTVAWRLVRSSAVADMAVDDDCISR